MAGSKAERTKWRRGFAGAGLLALCFVARTAHAEETEADRLFRDARTEMKAGRYNQGCAKFKESFQLDPTAGTMLNIGDCEEKQGHVAAAYNAFARGLKMLPKSDARTARTSERLQALAAKLAWLRVNLPSEYLVLVDDNVVDANDGVFALDPGDHAVRLRRKYESDVLLAVSVKMGETKTLDGNAVKPVAIALPPPEPVSTVQTTAWTLDVMKKPEAPAQSSRKTVAYVSFGVAGMAIATGTVSGIIALNAASVVKSDCQSLETGELRCGDRGFDASRRGKTMSTVSTVAFGTAIVAGAAGAILLLTAPNEAPKRKAVQFVPVATGEGAGAFIIGTL